MRILPRGYRKLEIRLDVRVIISWRGRNGSVVGLLSPIHTIAPIVAENRKSFRNTTETSTRNHPETTQAGILGETRTSTCSITPSFDKKVCKTHQSIIHVIVAEQIVEDGITDIKDPCWRNGGMLL
jgi:hypothetical protein